MPTSFNRLFMTAALFATAVFAQDQRQLVTAKDYCVKVAPEKAAQYESFMHEFLMPMNQARADNGEIAWSLVARAVVPSGKSAPCDYRTVYGYNGYPGDPTPDFGVIDAALKRAKLNMTAAQMLAKLTAMGELANVEYWVAEAQVGSGQGKGSYLILNHYKANNAAEWLRLETTYWQPLVAEHVKGGAKAAWSVWEMWIPGGAPPGDSSPYNVQTVDQFPDWNSLVHGLPVGELWPKVHPHEEMTHFFDADGKAASTYDREVYKVVDIVAASNGISK